MSSVYNETLPFKGKLIVSDADWNIQYYFTGPDTRYKGLRVTIKGQEIDQYINAWKNNFKEYEKIKSSYNGLPIEKKGEMGMSIKMGYFCEGVCLLGNNLPISTRKQLDKVIESYEYARSKAIQILKEP